VKKYRFTFTSATLYLLRPNFAASRPKKDGCLRWLLPEVPHRRCEHSGVEAGEISCWFVAGFW